MSHHDAIFVLLSCLSLYWSRTFLSLLPYLLAGYSYGRVDVFLVACLAAQTLAS